MPVLKVKENGEWLNVGSIAGGITVDTTNSNIGTPNGINADTLGGNTLQQIMLAMYPVGAIYMSANSVSPADLFGGTWEQIQDTFLLAAGSSYAAGSTGGEAAHTLTVDEIPSHKHTLVPSYGQSITTNARNHGKVLGAASSAGWVSDYTNDENNGPILGTGGNKSHNNMPPYLAVYMWRRVS